MLQFKLCCTFCSIIKFHLVWLCSWNEWSNITLSICSQSFLRKRLSWVLTQITEPKLCVSNVHLHRSRSSFHAFFGPFCSKKIRILCGFYILHLTYLFMCSKFNSNRSPLWKMWWKMRNLWFVCKTINLG